MNAALAVLGQTLDLASITIISSAFVLPRGITRATDSSVCAALLHPSCFRQKTKLTKFQMASTATVFSFRLGVRPARWRNSCGFRTHRMEQRSNDTSGPGSLKFGLGVSWHFISPFGGVSKSSLAFLPQRCRVSHDPCTPADKHHDVWTGSSCPKRYCKAPAQALHLPACCLPQPFDDFHFFPFGRPAGLTASALNSKSLYKQQAQQQARKGRLSAVDRTAQPEKVSPSGLTNKIQGFQPRI